MNAELRTRLLTQLMQYCRQLLFPGIELKPFHLDAIVHIASHSDERDYTAASGEVQRAAERFDVERVDGDLDMDIVAAGHALDP